MTVQATVLGYSRFAGQRALEPYGQRQIMSAELDETVRMELGRRWRAMKAAGIDHVPSNDFSLSDRVLDTTVMLGFVPARYRKVEDPLARYLAPAHGGEHDGVALPALPTSRWFDTEDHYLVPELEPGALAALHADKILREFEDARALGITTRPVILGPVSFLKLSRLAPGASGSTLALLETVLNAYAGLLSLLGEEGVPLVQLDEPCLVGASSDEREAYRAAFERLSSLTSRPRVLLATYFGALGESLPIALGAGFEALHVDLVRAPEQLDEVLAALPARMSLSLGLIDGASVWRSDLEAPLRVIRKVVAKLGTQRVWVAPSCSLLHVPEDLDAVRDLDDRKRSWLAFAAQKLVELRTLADLANAGEQADAGSKVLQTARAVAASRREGRL